jgi:hypothetical protein
VTLALRYDRKGKPVKRKAPKRPPQPPAPPLGQPLSTFDFSNIPDNDPGWRTIHDFIEIGVRRLKNLELAIADTRRGIAAGNIPVMLRRANPPKGWPAVHRNSPELNARLAPFIDLRGGYEFGSATEDSQVFLHIIGAQIIWRSGGLVLVHDDEAKPTLHPGGRPRTRPSELRERILQATAIRIAAGLPKTQARLRRDVFDMLELDSAKGDPDADSTWFKQLVDPIHKMAKQAKARPGN